VVAEVRTELARLGIVNWRNNVGQLQDATGRYVRYGLCEGSADLIACVPVGPCVCGCTACSREIGRFVGIEVKGPRTATSSEQYAWQAIVRQHGGIVEIVHDASEIARVLEIARS
jgi:hypothetical protein